MTVQLEKSNVFAVTGLPQASDLQRAINAGLVAEKDIDFACSLIAAEVKYGSATPKQSHWIGVLYNRAVTPKAEAKKVDLNANMAPIYAMFDRAGRHVKAPAIVIASDVFKSALRLNVATANASVPGSINVLANDRDTISGRREWFGRVHKDGKYEQTRKAVPDQDAVTALLTAFAADPAGVAKASAKLTGRCCFCNKKLGEGKDKRSVAVGYGPDCAAHFGLPWGETDETWKEVEATAKPAARAAAKWEPRQGDDGSWVMVFFGKDRGTGATRYASRAECEQAIADTLESERQADFDEIRFGVQ